MKKWAEVFSEMSEAEKNEALLLAKLWMAKMVEFKPGDKALMEVVVAGLPNAAGFVNVEVAREPDGTMREVQIHREDLYPHPGYVKEIM